jgi:hypothetical protein
MTAQRIAPQHLLHQQRQARKAFPHVGVAGRQPHSHPLRKWDHDCARTFRTRRSAAASTPLSMITRDPPSSAISIRPGDAHDEDSEVSAGIVGSGNDGGLLAEHASLTIAGANAVVSSVATSPPSRAAPREQLARGQSVSPRRHRHKPRPTIALRHDPLLLFQPPPAPRARRDNFEPGGLRHTRMVSHTPMSSPPRHIAQGGPRRRDTVRSPLWRLL